jgi:signal transduction histidine kinase/CheY-like chemotaxis protein
MALWIWEGKFWLMLYGFISAVPLIANVFLISKKKFALASMNIFLFGLVNIFIYDDGIGGNNGFYYFFFSELISIYILFDNSEKRYQFVAIIALLLTVLLTNIPGWSPNLYARFPDILPSTKYLSRINFFMSLACTLGQVWFMLKAIRKAEKSYILSLAKAEELAETKSQFLSNMSHELRTPMNAVIGLSDLLIRDNPDSPQRKNLDALKFSSYHLLHIINDILDYSRIEAGKVELEASNFDLLLLLNNLETSLTPLAAEKNLDLIFDLDPNLSRCLIGDANRLTQVLNNLINNGIKFTDKGWIRVQIIVLKLEEDATSIKFLVKDTGIGIPTDKTALIFERFTQASSETTRKYGGTGLGLAICNKLLLLQDSHISVQSILGEGSEFSFELRFKKAALKVPDNKLIDTDCSSLNGLHVLLAEDNEINQLVAKKYLESWGVELKTVKNGIEAVNYLDTHHVDLVLMDLQMPEMDGYQASRKIREMHNGKYSSLPIIALTASSQFEVGEQYRKSGMNDYVHKPFNPDLLYRIIASHTLA